MLPLLLGEVLGDVDHLAQHRDRLERIVDVPRRGVAVDRFGGAQQRLVVAPPAGLLS